jgi:hypothetical protein
MLLFFCSLLVLFNKPVCAARLYRFLTGLFTAVCALLGLLTPSRRKLVDRLRINPSQLRLSLLFLLLL